MFPTLWRPEWFRATVNRVHKRVLGASLVSRALNLSSIDAFKYLGAVDAVETFEQLLKRRAQFIIKCRLAGENSVTTRLRGSNHSQHGVSRWVGFMRMI